MEERRTQPRASVDWRVKFGVAGEELNNGFVSEVNAAGLSILSQLEYPVGTELEVHFGAFQSNSETQFRLRAVVRYVTHGKMGMKFLEGPVTDHELLLRLMRGVF